MVRGSLVCLLFLALLAEARQQPAEDQQAIAQKAVEAERRGDFATAVSVFKQLISTGADSPELRSNLGIAYFQLRDYEQSIRQFHLVLSKDLGSVPANFFSGLCLLKLQRPKEAVPFLRNADHAQPGDSNILVALCRAVRRSYTGVPVGDTGQTKLCTGLGRLGGCL